MKKKCSLILQLAIPLCLLLSSEALFAQPKKDLVLWYNRPAKDWNEALPIRQWTFGCYGIWKGRGRTDTIE